MMIIESDGNIFIGANFVDAALLSAGDVFLRLTPVRRDA